MVFSIALAIRETDLFRTVTSDEMWISYVSAETKKQSLQRFHSGSSKLKKFKQAQFKGKSLSKLSHAI